MTPDRRRATARGQMESVMVVALFLAVTTAYATYPMQVETAWSDTGRRFTSMEACQAAGRRASAGVLPMYRCEWHEGSL